MGDAVDKGVAVFGIDPQLRITEGQATEAGIGTRQRKPLDKRAVKCHLDHEFAVPVPCDGRPVGLGVELEPPHVGYRRGYGVKVELPEQDRRAGLVHVRSVDRIHNLHDVQVGLGRAGFLDVQRRQRYRLAEPEPVVHFVVDGVARGAE